MIKLVCPKCKKPSDKAKTKLVIEAVGYTRIVPSREQGVERAISSPIEVAANDVRIDIPPGTTMYCSRCGEEAENNLWKYTVLCDHCGLPIARKPVKDPSEIVDEHICRDTMSLFCASCWSRSSSNEYCPNCRYRDACLLYNNSR